MAQSDDTPEHHNIIGVNIVYANVVIHLNRMFPRPT